ncbi:MAG: cobalamin B12-binding domain-containing protein [Thermacetogeniaceae bacterium]
MEKLVNLVADLKEKEINKEVDQLLMDGHDPRDILDACRKAVSIVGDRFQNGEYFVPDLVLSGVILNDVFNKVKPKIKSSNENQTLGKVVIGTVEGDVHDIGKNIVNLLLDVNGFQVIDLGVDVPPEEFVRAVKEEKPLVLGLSGLLTLAAQAMKDTVDAIKEAGLRDQVKIIIGGAVADQNLKEFVGADEFGKDAQDAVTFAKKFL